MTGHFEAKKIAWRQTKDGLVLALSVHPDEMPSDLAIAPLNTRYMIGYAEIGDDEKPIELVRERPSPPTNTNGEREVSGSASTSLQAEGGSPKKSWNDFKPSQQITILCGDIDFQHYLGVRNEDEALFSIKEHLRVKSRREIDRDPENAARWNEMHALFQLYRERHK